MKLILPSHMPAADIAGSKPPTAIHSWAAPFNFNHFISKPTHRKTNRLLHWAPKKCRMAQMSSQLLSFLLVLLTLPFLNLCTTLPTCVAPAPDTPLWTISDWSTDFTLPDGGAVIFRLHNTLTGYGALCFRRGAFPEGQCIWVDGGTGEEDDTETWFAYDETVGNLLVQQGWSCDGET